MNVTRNNAAARVVKILHKANSLSEGTKTYNVWGIVFALPETMISDDNKAEIIEEIIFDIKLLKKEIELITAYMEKTDCPEHLWKPQINTVKHALLTDALSSEWRIYKGYLQGNALFSLQWCAATMPHEEEVITKDDLVEIIKQVDELSTSINTSSLPDSVKELIQHYLNIIRKSIRQYEIVGSQSFIKVEEALLVDLHKNGKIIKKYVDNEFVKSITRIFRIIFEKSKKLKNSLLEAKATVEALEYFRDIL